jgi:PadR family transcriptional regulator PadR
LSEGILSQLRKGVLEMCVLKQLSRGDSYAYEIAQILTSEVGMAEGTIYPLMRRMADEGLVSNYMVKSDSGPSRKYFRLTELGRRTLARQLAEWASFDVSVRQFLKGGK